MRTNLFSFNYRDYPQPYTSWLFDLAAYVLWTRGGGAAIQAAQALLIAAALWVTALACRVRASGAATLAVCAVGWTMAFAREHGLQGPVFTSINLGGFVAWELYPSARVFQDARLQAYPPAHFRAIADASKSPEAWAGLTRGVDWAVVSLPRANDWSGVGMFDPAEWGTAYRDEAVEIVVRRASACGALARPRY